MKVRPTRENINSLHTLTFEWGPWGHGLQQRLPAAGLLVTTGKSVNRDGVSRDLNLTCDRPVYVLFGAGEDFSGESVVDIRRGWELVNPMAAKEERLAGPSPDD
jgi:hypothetical protein